VKVKSPLLLPVAVVLELMMPMMAVSQPFEPPLCRSPFESFQPA
jgi:hypothetical protein